MKKLLMILIPLLLVGGGVVGLGLGGILKIPGLTPAKKKQVAAGLYADPKDLKPKEEEKKPAVAAAKPKKKAPTVAVATNDPVLGRKKLAKVWAELEPGQINGITKAWKVEELCEVFLMMDPAKVSEVLAVMDAKRADAVSRAILRQAGRIVAKSN